MANDSRCWKRYWFISTQTSTISIAIVILAFHFIVMIKIWFRDIESGKLIQAGFSFDSGHEDIVEFFIDKKVDVNQRDFFNFTALHYAASKGNLKKLLFSGLLQILISNITYATKTIFTVFLVHSVSICNIGLQQPHHGTFIQKKPKLKTFFNLGHERICRLLLRKGAVNVQNINRWTALHYASFEGYCRWFSSYSIGFRSKW